MLTRRMWNPGSLMNLGEDFDRFFDAWGTGLDEGQFRRMSQAPAMNVWEEDDAYFAEAEVPGVKPEDVDIKVKGHVFTLSVKHDGSSEQNEGKFYRRERISGESTRTATFPVELNSNLVEANLKDGVLKIKLPKAEAEATRKIPVKSA